MAPTLEQYLEDAELRAAIERRAHRERAEQMHRYFAQAAVEICASLKDKRMLEDGLRKEIAEKYLRPGVDR